MLRKVIGKVVVVHRGHRRERVDGAAPILPETHSTATATTTTSALVAATDAVAP